MNGATVVATSTNGVRGILSANKADKVITASFLNYKAVLKYLHSTAPRKITIVAMGEFEKPSEEDTLFSFMLRDYLTGGSPDIGKVKEKIYASETVGMMRSFFGDEIDKDIDFCLDTTKEFNVVPILSEGRLEDALR